MKTHIQDRNHDVRHGRRDSAIGLGCASSPPLRTAASTSGIRAAEEVGAAKVPQASLQPCSGQRGTAERQGAGPQRREGTGSVNVVAC